MLTSDVMLLYDTARLLLTLGHCWSISTGSCLTTLLTALISLWATNTSLPTWRTWWNHSNSTIMKTWWKVSKWGWGDHQQTSLIVPDKNLFNNTRASIMVMTISRSTISMYVFFAYNISPFICCFIESWQEVAFQITPVQKVYTKTFADQKYSCARTKCVSAVSNAYTRCAHEELENNLNCVNFVMVSCNISIHMHLKQIPVLIHYFQAYNFEE
jgi:hypothetical protein